MRRRRRRMIEGGQQTLGRRLADSARPQFSANPLAPDLVQLVDRDERLVVETCRHSERLQHAAQQTAMVDANDEVGEPELPQHVAHGATDFRLDNRRGRADGVDVALIELTEAAARRPVGAPDRLDLIALEEPRQLAAMLGDHPRERHRQVVAQGQVGLARGLVLAAAEHFENELVAFFPVLAGQRLDVLEGRSLERLEPVPAIGPLDDADHECSATDVVGEEVAHAARRPGVLRHQRPGTHAAPEPGLAALRRHVSRNRFRRHCIR